MDLLDLRKQIDEIDEQLIPLLLQRMDISKKVAEYKVKRGLPVLNEQREREILDDVQKNAASRATRWQRFLPQRWMLPVHCSTKSSAAAGSCAG